MANYLTSNEFTFVHPSSTGLLSAGPVASAGYNADFLLSQNVFSPINCTLPTTIQFPTPPVTSLPFNSSGLGPCLAETSLNPNVYDLSLSSGSCLPVQNCQPVLSTWSQVTPVVEPSRLSTLVTQSMPTLPAASGWSEKLSGNMPSQIRCKRKATDQPEDCWMPTKIHVNEERMSACMNDLHLDNNNIGAQPNFENEPWYSRDVKMDTRAVEPESLDMTPEHDSKLRLNRNSRLELCQELQLGLKTKEILPKVIWDEMIKSSMQVVLWKPPELFGQQLLEELPENDNASMQGENSQTDDSKKSSSSQSSLLSSSSSSCVSSEKWMTGQSLPLNEPVTDFVDDCEDMDL